MYQTSEETRYSSNDTFDATRYRTNDGHDSLSYAGKYARDT